MRVRIVPYAELRRQVLPKGQDVLWLDLPEGSTVADVLKRLNVKTEDRLIVGLDGSYATPDMALHDQAELTLVTPMEGG
jgi:sulfur carrier protein ThiS